MKRSRTRSAPQEKPIFYHESVAAALQQLESSPEGLSKDVAARRLASFGANQLPVVKQSWLKRLLEPFANVFIIALVLALIVSAIRGEKLDASIIALVILFDISIYYFQQISVSRALRALQSQDKQEVQVRRAGNVIIIDATEVVPGDILLLQEGMKIPADGRLISADQLRIDESILTGESLPVHKSIEELSGQKELYDQKNMAFKGTLVQSGLGELLITKTGAATELGSIQSLVSNATIDKSPIEKKIDSLAKHLIAVIAVLAAGVFVLAISRGIETEEALRFSLSMLVSAVPEGLPIALTVMLFIGAKRLAKAKVLVKKFASIETLGALTLIATDKTGTLTHNKLSIAALAHQHGSEQQFKQLLTRTITGDGGKHGDALDHLLHTAIDIPPSKDTQKVKDLPFDQELRASGAVWKENGKLVVYLKGAPESLLHGKHADGIIDLKKQTEMYAMLGYRTIAVGKATVSKLPEKLTASLVKQAAVEGLIGLSDPLRRDVKQAIVEAHQAGVKVIMLTGDHQHTAHRIAQEAGLITHAHEVSDAELLQGPAKSIRTAAAHINVFARVLPEHKFQFVKAHKGHQVTAMTGDGINDIPAIVEADAGLAMGSGTDATKEASDLVLLDNRFSTIIAGMRLGRSIIANIRKVLFYLLATNLGEALTMVGALLFDLPLPVTAAQILWINLVTDSILVIPLGLGNPEPQQMKQPPNRPDAPLLPFRLLSRLVLVAITMAGLALWFFYNNLHHGTEYAQTVVFMVLVVSQWANAVSANFEFHSWMAMFRRPNYKLLAGLVLAISIQSVIMFTPAGRLLEVTQVPVAELAKACGIAILVVLFTGDIHKLLSRLLQPKAPAILEKN